VLCRLSRVVPPTAYGFENLELYFRYAGYSRRVFGISPEDRDRFERLVDLGLSSRGKTTRHASAHGHRVVLLPPHAVRPYVPRNKTDRADATALLEAARNEAIHPVPVKSIPQQTLTAPHRLRAAWTAARTARLNTVRGVLREFGVAIPVGARSVLPRVTALLAADHGLPPALHPALTAAAAEIRDLESRIHALEQQLAVLAATTPGVAPLQTIPGIGLLTATALVAFVGDAQRFPSGRPFASNLGLTPREHSSGLRRRLGAISKRGDPYLRMLLVHGARSILWHAKRTPTRSRLHAWGLALEGHRGHNKAAVALANKLARCAWAVWTTNRAFRAMPDAA